MGTNTVQAGPDLRPVIWGDGSGVPTSGQSFVVAGLDGNGLLHIRAFDATGVRTDTFEQMEGGAAHLVTTNASGTVLSDIAEASMYGTQATALANFKQQLSSLTPPTVLTLAQSQQFFLELTSILGSAPQAGGGTYTITGGLGSNQYNLAAAGTYTITGGAARTPCTSRPPRPGTRSFCPRAARLSRPAAPSAASPSRRVRRA